ncbi:MAG: hypothetical protein DLM53_10090 [Candidatus Eremiobacter antarcticus]|nr:aspartyl protease family protein [Candidatus Eremiobacteraeota bacterium]MBC5807182.1 aspartyl protease family protein [Candidatus Eremiobacteraeota bacterium]PZR60993.1 MAG: hypothetical protein DLM53_10090 [Candidatus Eremiobacter sp. RRmetagenome_bin22]
MTWPRALLVLAATATCAGTLCVLGAAASLADAQRTGNQHSQDRVPSVEEIASRHRAALGKLPALIAHWSGSISKDAQNIHYDIVAARDGRFRQVFSFPLLQRSEGSNGSVDWTQDENGDVFIETAQHHVSMDARLVRLNDARIDAQHSFVSGVAQINGRRAYALNTVVAGNLSTIYIDAASALVDGADFGQYTVRYGAYRRFQGVPVPTQVTETDGDSAFTVTVDDVDFRLTRNDFEPPPQRRPQFPDGVREVSMKFDSPRGLIVVAAAVNGNTVRLLVDSGSTTSIIDADVAKRLKLPTGGAARIQGVGTMTGSVAKIDSFDLGGMLFRPFFMEAVPLRLPSALAHNGIDGILGYDLLASLVMRISYKHGQLRFMLPESFTYAGNGTVIPVDTAKRVPLVGASVGLNDRGQFTIDTGSDAKLVLYRKFADANRRDFIMLPLDVVQAYAAGAAGEFPTRLETISRLNLGSYSLPNVLAQVALREVGAFGQSSADGIIGAGSLALFEAVFLDYAGKRLILEQ